MKLQTIFRACDTLVRAKAKTSPGCMIPAGDEKISCKELSKELNNLENWCYKDELEVKQVVRCKNCVYYKRYKKKSQKNPHKHIVFCACSKDKIKREPEFFCANGREK